MIELTVNGARCATAASGRRLADLLRDDLALEGTKLGCDAGDCGSCSVLLDGDPVCACMVPVGGLAGRHVTTVEHVGDDELGRRLQQSFVRHGAAQCGFCTPAMVICALALLRREPFPTEAQVHEALGGVLCRCTGYRSIIEAVIATNADAEPFDVPSPAKTVGARLPRVDGPEKVAGTDRFGDDGVPADASTVTVIRSPHHRASFEFGDLDGFVATNDGVLGVLTAADVPGRNAFGVLGGFADQPVFATGETRHLGEAVAAIVSVAPLAPAVLTAFPATWHPLDPVLTIAAARAADATLLHRDRPGNVLVRGFVRRGDDVDEVLAASAHRATHSVVTPFVEHAPIEPEAGWAWLDGDTVTVVASTQAPAMDREALAEILALPLERVRIVPTAVGGGFGTKLDLSVQPFIALAALRFGRPARLRYTRPESMQSTTKRHPAELTANVACDADGMLTAVRIDGVFNTGAYASWGPTVANRVPVHGAGPYSVPHYRAEALAIHTHSVSAGAFRGFGVPQTAIAQESAFDLLADAAGVDRLEFRMRNALRVGQPTVTGQVFHQGIGYRQCLEALEPAWLTARERRGPVGGALVRGVGVAGAWYGCGNTSLPNPSTILVGVTTDGQLVLHQGAVDIGQGSNTVMTQIFAQALGVPVGAVRRVGADTAITPDAGKTSASRQTFVTGNAVRLAAEQLRRRLLDDVGCDDADAEFEVTAAGALIVCTRDRRLPVDLHHRAPDEHGYALSAVATYDPPTTPLDADGQGAPYATYGFGAQLVELLVDTATGRVTLEHVVAAYDVGKAVNPTLIEGQIHGGVAQGIGLALTEEYHAGRGDNLHDYLIPTIGDVPPIVSFLVESGDEHGAFGVKGIGEHTLIPTAPAILNAIRDAIGVPLTAVPATPERVLAAIEGGRR